MLMETIEQMFRPVRSRAAIIVRRGHEPSGHSIESPVPGCSRTDLGRCHMQDVEVQRPSVIHETAYLFSAALIYDHHLAGPDGAARQSREALGQDRPSDGRYDDRQFISDGGMLWVRQGGAPIIVRDPVPRAGGRAQGISR